MNESIEWYWLWRTRDFTKQLQHDIQSKREVKTNGYDVPKSEAL